MQEEQIASTQTSSPEIYYMVSGCCECVLPLYSAYAWEAVHDVRSSNTTDTDLVRNDSADADSDGDPVQLVLCTPPIDEVSDGGVDKAYTQSPESHFGLSS
jgi:hypothetical protein